MQTTSRHYCQRQGLSHLSHALASGNGTEPEAAARHKSAATVTGPAQRRRQTRRVLTWVACSRIEPNSERAL